ncbi:MAG: FMN-binding glutamate synthase family protein [Vulcanimicrobiota bacterium]
MSTTRSLFKRGYSQYLVERSGDCLACTTCQASCPQGVHVRKLGFNTMEEPLHELCLGPSCSGKPESCVNRCPKQNLQVISNPELQCLGDFRWTPELLIATYRAAETGELQPREPRYQRGSSGGGFDVMDFRFPEKPSTVRADEVDISLPLNRRKNKGAEITIPFPMYGGGMSFGSVSLAVMQARAMAAQHLGSFISTGEGGYPEELFPYSDNIIVQVATGLFGVREETVAKSRIVEFKYAQGAKPGLGGHLLGDKVTPRVATLRQSVPWRSLFSPFPFHSVYSVEDHMKHLDWISSMNPEALISVKVSSPGDIDMVAVGSYYAGANIIHIDGGYGGTGASPDIAKKNIAMPIEYAIRRAHKFLSAEGIRDEIVLMVSGGLRTYHDIAKAIALGADGVVIGTADIVSLECVRCGNCESGRGCPRGIATTDEKLEMLISAEWGAERIINLYRTFAQGLRELIASLGFRSVKELRGRIDVLKYPVEPL